MITDQDSILFKKAARCYRAVNHKLRKDILEFIAEEAKTVTAIYVHLRLEQSVASQHLRILRDAGLVTTRRDGKEIHYKGNAERIKHYINISKELVS